VGEWASGLGLCLILDIHNYGKYRGAAIGAQTVPMSALADLWVRLHGEFGDPGVYAYGLMNEPAGVPVKSWTQVAQSTVMALRAAGATNLILVGTGRWSGAHELFKQFDATTADGEFSGFQDPLDRLVIELHQYADSDYSGRGSDCIDPAKLRQILDRAAQWSRAHSRKVFLGEFGVAANSPCLATLDSALKAMTDSSAWKGWTYWSAGRWWGSYAYSVQPNNGADTAQMAVLRKYTNRPQRPTNLIITR
jgi:endoglucanase